MVTAIDSIYRTVAVFFVLQFVGSIISTPSKVFVSVRTCFIKPTVCNSNYIFIRYAIRGGSNALISLCQTLLKIFILIRSFGGKSINCCNSYVHTVRSRYVDPFGKFFICGSLIGNNLNILSRSSNGTCIIFDELLCGCLFCREEILLSGNGLACESLLINRITILIYCWNKFLLFSIPNFVLNLVTIFIRQICNCIVVAVPFMSVAINVTEVLIIALSTVGAVKRGLRRIEYEHYSGFFDRCADIQGDIVCIVSALNRSSSLAVGHVFIRLRGVCDCRILCPSTVFVIRSVDDARLCSTFSTPPISIFCIFRKYRKRQEREYHADAHKKRKSAFSQIHYHLSFY